MRHSILLLWTASMMQMYAFYFTTFLRFFCFLVTPNLLFFFPPRIWRVKWMENFSAWSHKIKHIWSSLARRQYSRWSWSICFPKGIQLRYPKLLRYCRKQAITLKQLLCLCKQLASQRLFKPLPVPYLGYSEGDLCWCPLWSVAWNRQTCFYQIFCEFTIYTKIWRKVFNWIRVGYFVLNHLFK